MIEKGSKAAIVGCSNGLPETGRAQIHRLEAALLGIGLTPVISGYLYGKDSVFGGSARERAKSLMDFYADDEIKVIFDVSGGDIANEVLSYLDFDQIARADKYFWGYSDLTVVINAIYAKTGKASVLYQVRNLIYEDAQHQVPNFSNTVLYGKEDLFSFKYKFVQKQNMQGIVVGGNIRCLLKLAGTQYWPDMTNKILLLESFGGTIPQMVTYLNQLKQIGVFEQINGILLGTFTKMENEGCRPDIIELVKNYAGTDIPVVKTGDIGHGINSKAVIIGKEMILSAHSSAPVY